MKRFFLIPLMSLLTCVMAWGAEVGTFAELQTALAGSDALITATAKIEIASDVALDLNGKTVNFTDGWLAINSGNVSIENGTISVASNLWNAIELYGGSLTLNCTVIGGQYNGIYMSGGDLTVNGGTISGPNNGIYTAGGTIIANAGTIRGTNYQGIYSNGNATSIFVGNATLIGSSYAFWQDKFDCQFALLNGSANNFAYVSNLETLQSALGMASIEHIWMPQINITSSVELDLNGKTLKTVGAGYSFYVNYSGNDECVFTLKNGSIIATNAQGLSCCAIGKQNTGKNVTITVDNCNIDVTGYPAYGIYPVGTNSNAVIKNSTLVVNSQDNSAYGVRTGVANPGPEVTVTNSNITANGTTAFALYLASGTTATVNSGNLTANGTDRTQSSAGVFVDGRASNVTADRKTTLNVNGGTITAPDFAIAGNGSTNNTVINITGGTIGSEETALAIYHPQSGTLNIENGTLIGKNSAIEMRAGTLTIDGGSFTATATTSSVAPNGNGCTTIGSAISIAQHTTKLPIAVTIDGGEFRAIYPIAQYNPQKNETAYVDQVNITVNGGKFWATNTADVAAYTEDNKLSLTGGYYNLAPHAFVANGYVAINNPDEAPLPSVADGYLFKVVQLVPETFESTLTEGNWVMETTWEDNPSVSAQIPTQQSNVTIPDGGNVYVQPTSEEEVVAYAHNLTLAGDATLTVKDGATLVLGNEATVANTANLVVEAGGQLLIAPSESEVHPIGSVTLIADAAGLKQPGLIDSDPNNLYWQHFAIPTTEAPTIRVEDKDGNEITTPITYYNTWDIVNGWENVLKTDMNTPFQGYNLSNDRVYHSDIRYIFSGPLVGNASNPLVFARRGFSFFGNSYLAPINIRALQAAMYEQGMEYTVYVYVHRNASGPQIYRAINDVTAGIYGIEEIKPLEGFFMFAEEASQADFQYNSAVYSAFLNKQMGGQMVNNAPARNAKSAYDAKAVIAVEAQNGESDEVILVASENFSNDYDLKADARKMENSGMNIYADGSFDNLAVMATNDLMGQTLSFRAGKDALYTMTFSNVEGELALYDNEVNQTISIAEGSTYTFAAQPNSTVNGRFEIVKPAMLPTAIENTEAKANIKGIYSITGMYLGENFNALPAGVYVVNGVKIVK